MVNDLWMNFWYSTGVTNVFQFIEFFLLLIAVSQGKGPFIIYGMGGGGIRVFSEKYVANRLR